MEKEELLKSLQKNKRYDALMLTAREIFWKYGFKRVSIEEICTKAGISKMTFYRLFPNKLELAKAVYDKQIDNGLIAFRALLFSKDHTPEEKVKGMIMMKAEGTHDISPEFLNDFYTSTEIGLKEHIENKTREAWTGVMNDFKKAQQEGVFRKDFKPELFFAMAESVMPILSNKALVDSYANPQELILEIANLMMYGIIQK